MKAYRESGFPITIIRPSHTYCERSIPIAIHGKCGSWQTILRMKQGKPIIIPGDGAKLWTCTHSRDFAVGFVGLMGNAHALGETYHITSDESCTWNQIYQSIANALGVKLNAVHIASETLAKLSPDWVGALLGDKSNTVIFDNSKIKRAVPQFCCTTRYDQGMREALAYIEAHPECQKLDPEFDAWCDAVTDAYAKLEQALPKLEA